MKIIKCLYFLGHIKSSEKKISNFSTLETVDPDYSALKEQGLQFVPVVLHIPFPRTNKSSLADKTNVVKRQHWHSYLRVLSKWQSREFWFTILTFL